MVVETRARKRCQQNDDNDQQEETPASLEKDTLLLEEDDGSRSMKKKQRQIEEDVQDGTQKLPFDMICATASETLFSFLDTRDIFNLSKCSKSIRDCITSEIVIRSAVFGGEKTKTVVQNIIISVENKSIHVPSTLRLLRLVNGTKCETGDQCFSYNLINKTSEAFDAKCTNRPFGLMICPTCAKCISCPSLNKNCAVANRLEYSHGGLLRQPFTETATGERAGPLVLAHQVKQLGATYRTKEEKQQAFDRLYEAVDQESPQDTTRAQAIVEAYYDAVSDYDAFVEAKNQRITKMQQEEEAESASKRREKQQKVYRKLEVLLDDFAHKNLALNCTWCQYGYCHFTYKPAGAIFNDLVRKPSQATKKKIATAVERARQFVDKIHSYGLVAGAPSVLGGAEFASRRERHVKFVVRYVTQLAVEQWEELLNPKFSSDATAFVKSVEEGGKPFDVLLELLNSAAPYMAHYDPMIFCHIVKERNEARRTNLIELAKKIWIEKFSRRSPYSECNTEQTFRIKFESCCRQYESLHSSIRDYLSDPLTVAFLTETGPPPSRNPNERVTRQDAVDKMYTNDRYIRLLRSRDFESLLHLQRRHFQNPSSFHFW